MTRSTSKLSATAVEKRKTAGRMGDGGGLWLNITKSGRKAWVYRWKIPNSKVTEMGLGPYPTVSLSDARELALECRKQVVAGKNPIVERDRQKQARRTFADATSEFFNDNASGWENAKHRQQWQNTLATYCKPINSRNVDEITIDDVLRCLRPIWDLKPETASRVRGRIERVISYSMTRGWRQDANPAIWRGNLSNILQKPKKLYTGHHAAMAWKDVPAFLEQLREFEALSARALELLILTALRTSEVLNAHWDEINFEEALWTVPLARLKTRNKMKVKNPHRVPLSKSALALLATLHESRTSDWIFPGQKPNKPLSNMAMEMMLRRMKVEDVTVHGFRSSFRDWAGDETEFHPEIIEMALAHKIGDDAEIAYRRSDSLEKRRRLMDAWSVFCSGTQSNNVVQLHG